MRKLLLITTLVLTLCTTALADMPQAVWVGGGAQASDGDRPAYMLDAMVSLGSYGGPTFFLAPMLTLKHSELGVDFGLGGRMPVFEDAMLLGGNVFYDYTGDHNHRRVGVGAELFHPLGSAHLNLYLPISDREGDEQAISGGDFQAGIPIPNYSFISIWPGVYFYNGKHADDLKGLSLALQIKPIPVLTITTGARNDTPAAGKDERELFARVEISIPLSSFDKNLFAFTKGDYPLDIKKQMDQRVQRERFIAIEKMH